MIKKELFKKIIILCFFLCVSIGYLLSNLKDAELEEYGVVGKAKIIRIMPDHRKDRVRLKYMVDNLYYETQLLWRGDSFPKIGLEVKIIYSSINPQNCKIEYDK